MMATKEPALTVVLITGASSGIGLLTADRLHALGYRVYGTSRRPEKHAVPFTMLRMDVTDPVSIDAALAELMKKEEGVDVLVNNAGMGIGGSVEESTSAMIREQMDTVFFGMVEVTRRVLPLMRRRGGGRIINVSSIAGRMGLPYQGYYSAAKFAVEGLSEALSIEVKSFGIDVVLVEPGDMSTGFTSARKWILDESSPYGRQVLKTKEIIEKNEQKGGDPGKVARKIVRIIRRKHPRFRYMTGKPEEKLAVVIRIFLPFRLFERILALFYGVKMKKR
jgi:NAD(P)-dependent dehydrogenase (short-subunit alcohol dehydrogenase family)